ncbi:TPA: tetratricopeptide repeat protein [Candidatus Poribacteria bacterium]|nr:tetratricopeptide repeat protein [Candidatus Poribacteria bacterium]
MGSKIGRSYSKQGQFDLAIEAYKTTIRLNPNPTIAYNNLACGIGREII